MIIELIAMNYPQMTRKNDAPSTHTHPYNSVTTHSHKFTYTQAFTVHFVEERVLFCVDYDDIDDDDYL